MQGLRNKDSTEIDKLRQALRACKLHLFDQFVLCLQTLRVGTLNQVLADNSDISLATVTRIFLSDKFFILSTRKYANLAFTC